MKKLLLAMGVMLCSLNITAQLIFVDAEGKELANGATITMDKAEMNDFDELEVLLEGVSIKNTSSSAQTFTMDAVVSALPSGSLNCCFGTTCRNATEPKTINLTGLKIAANTTTKIINTEWITEEGKYGTCKVQFKLSTGNTLNVEFVYADPSNVSGVAASQKIKAIYDMTGKQVKSLQRGINLVRYADGSVKKRVVR